MLAFWIRWFSQAWLAVFYILSIIIGIIPAVFVLIMSLPIELVLFIASKKLEVLPIYARHVVNTKEMFFPLYNLYSVELKSYKGSHTIYVLSKEHLNFLNDIQVVQLTDKLFYALPNVYA